MHERANMDGGRLTDEQLLNLLFKCAHRVSLGLRHSESFEEWSLMEIRALRAFEREWNHVLGATEVAWSIDCSLPYATKLLQRLAARGLIREGVRWRNFRSFVLTEKGLSRLHSDTSELEVFARCTFEGIEEEDRTRFVRLLATIRGNVSLPRRGHETY